MATLDPETQIECINCRYFNKINAPACFKCDSSLGATNVNLINTPSERQALEDRYQEAKRLSQAKIKLQEFEDIIQRDCHGILNIPYKVLESMVFDNEIYSNYHLLVDEGKREIADLANDLNRSKAESFLFGNSLSRKIIYATISINESGLNSYGNVVLILDEDAIKNRTSCLEENSYSFIFGRNINITDEIPKGFRSNWFEKHKLALAKLYREIEVDTDKDKFSQILLHSNGIRADEKFIEIYIFGNLGIDSFRKIKVHKSNSVIGTIKTHRNKFRTKRFASLQRRLAGKIEIYE